MNQNDRIVRIAHDLRQLIKAENDKSRLEDYCKLAGALKPVLDELADAGLVGPDVGLELNEYSMLKRDNASVAEEYGSSFDIGLEQYLSRNSIK